VVGVVRMAGAQDAKIVGMSCEVRQQLAHGQSALAHAAHRHRGDASKPPVGRSVRRSAPSGRCPLNLVNAGFGSRKSGPNGPPFMNR